MEVGPSSSEQEHTLSIVRVMYYFPPNFVESPREFGLMVHWLWQGAVSMETYQDSDYTVYSYVLTTGDNYFFQLGVPTETGAHKAEDSILSNDQTDNSTVSRSRIDEFSFAAFDQRDAYGRPAVQSYSTQLAAGTHSTCIVSDGRVYEWGCLHQTVLPAPTEVYFPSPELAIVQVSCGRKHTIALACA